MEDGKKCPPLPSNYVSLVQLRERWLKQQRRQQRGKEDEEGKQREKEEQEQKHEDQNGERSEANSLSISRRPFRRDRRNHSEKDGRTIDVSKAKSEESRIEAVVIHDEEQKNDESKKKKKKKKRKKNKRPRAEEDQTRGTTQLAAENEPEEKTPVVVTVRNGEKERIISEFRRNGNNQGVNRKVWEQKVPVDQTAEIGRNFGDLSLSGGKEGNVRSTAKMNGGHWRYGASRRFGRRKVRNQRDCNVAWVRKGDIPDFNDAES